MRPRTFIYLLINTLSGEAIAFINIAFINPVIGYKSNISEQNGLTKIKTNVKYV